MSPVLFGFLVIYSPKYSTYDTITEAHVRIHAIEELQPLNHQKLHQHGQGFCPPYWEETENQSSPAHKRNSGQWKRAKTSPRKCLSKKCCSPQGRPAKPVARTTSAESARFIRQLVDSALGFKPYTKQGNASVDFGLFR